ncbi:MAG TPA: hypothetical protein PLZ36_04530 [Armatimonadota bacterium]|nr:hypothetical protein [Armatimonadota bacterium]
MRMFTVMVAMAAFGSLALAAATTTVPASPTPGAAGVTGTTTTTTTGVTVAGTTMTTLPGCPANISMETACLINELRAARADLRAASLELRGQTLVDRMNALQTREEIFRQQVAANPTAQFDRATAQQLQMEAMAPSNDIDAFNRELSAIPADQRPYLAQRLNTFTAAYWQPATQQFAQYRTGFQQSSPGAYQPAFAGNAWLQTWHTNYSTALGNVSTSQQNLAAANWWSGTTAAAVPTAGTPQVLGATEMYPGMTVQPGSAIVLPAGTVIIVPPASGSPQVLGTTEMMNTGAVTNGYPAATGAP